MPDKLLLKNLKKTNRLYAVVSNVNNMILHIKDKDKIFAEACRIAVEEGQFEMSWIGLLDEKTATIQPVTWAGKEDGYFESIRKISAKNIPEGQGATGSALRDGKTSVVNDFATDPKALLWRDEALKRGYASSCAIPIVVNGKRIGVFSIYSSEISFFNDTEIRQLEALTGNIAFALEIIESDKLREKAERELTIANKKREEEILYSTARMSALGEMASGIAHEINNPLSIIIMKVSQMIRKHQSDTLERDELEDGLIKIAATSQRIGQVVKGLSSISRNPEHDPIKKIKLITIIEDTLQLCREKFKSHSIRLEVDLDSIADLEIEGRVPQIMQVLLNLLNNAFDATLLLPEKWVIIKAVPSEAGIIISVTDSGLGISDQLLGKIMQPFFTTKPLGKGTGLGLSISKGIIDEHQGQFYYQKNSAHTCFVIELPCT